jgi:hypothetical protein
MTIIENTWIDQIPLPKKNPSLLFWSSLVLGTNVWTAFLTRQYIYSLLFTSLVFCSLLVHTYNTLSINRLDKLFILSIVIYGAWKLSKKWSTAKSWQLAVCILTFLFWYQYSHSHLQPPLFVSVTAHQQVSPQPLLLPLGPPPSSLQPTPMHI